MGVEQQWVAVQEKTFTKWFVDTLLQEILMTDSRVAFRLNAKVSGRDVAVKNLVTDLSDGVRSKCPGHDQLFLPVLGELTCVP